MNIKALFQPCSEKSKGRKVVSIGYAVFFIGIAIFVYGYYNTILFSPDILLWVGIFIAFIGFFSFKIPDVIG